jgi:hypothetical protein
MCALFGQSSISSCMCFAWLLQAALQAPSEETRLHVWMLLNNISTAEPDCWQHRNMRYTTQIYGQIQDHTNITAVQEKQALNKAAAAAAAAVHHSNGFNVFALSFGFMRDVLVLPQQAADRFLQIQNVTLLQLPQGPKAAAAAGMHAGQGGDGPTPPDVWTLLLWSVNRCALCFCHELHRLHKLHRRCPGKRSEHTQFGRLPVCKTLTRHQVIAAFASHTAMHGCRS